MSVSKITNTAVLTTSNETLGLITASSGVIIPGLELVLELFFHKFVIPIPILVPTGP